MTYKITIFGGSGFVGRYVVRELARAGHQIRVACRTPGQAGFLKTAGSVGQITIVQANLRDGDSIQNAVKGSDIVINLVGVLYQHGNQRFDEIHAKGAERIAQSCAKAGVEHLIHMSALGVDKPSGSHYARSKMNGEKAVLSAFSGATILRPSIVFGPEDEFFNRFAAMACFSPILPLIGGKTRFQPVYVVDIGRVIARIVADKKLRGKTYELGGPKVYSFKRLMQFMLLEIHRRRLLLPVPAPFAKLMALGLQLLPNPLLTVDQVRLLKVDNVVSQGADGFDELEIIPASITDIVPRYLERYRKR